MQLKSLRLFLAVAQHGSFMAAAGQHYTVQSNVTAHIKKLEAELGQLLFDRQAPRARLTAAGVRLLEYAEDICRRHDQALAEFRGGERPGGRLRLGAMETTAAIRLPPLLAAFHARYPEVDLALTTGPSAELLEQLLAGRLDGVFVASQLPAEGFVQQVAFSERLALVANAPLAEFPAREALLGARFFAFRQGCTYRQRLELLFADLGLPPVRISEFGSLDAILGCVGAGMGFTLLPEAVVAAHRTRFALHTLPLPSPALAQAPTYFVVPAAGSATPQIGAFLGCLKDLEPGGAVAVG